MGAVPRRPVLDLVGLLLRLVLGGVLVVAGALKVGHLETSARAVRAYQLLPHDVAGYVGYALPVVEIAVGVLLALVGLYRLGGDGRWQMVQRSQLLSAVASPTGLVTTFNPVGAGYGFYSAFEVTEPGEYRLAVAFKWVQEQISFVDWVRTYRVRQAGDYGGIVGGASDVRRHHDLQAAGRLATALGGAAQRARAGGQDGVVRGDAEALAHGAQVVEPTGDADVAPRAGAGGVERRARRGRQQRVRGRAGERGQRPELLRRRGDPRRREHEPRAVDRAIDRAARQPRHR